MGITWEAAENQPKLQWETTICAPATRRTKIRHSPAPPHNEAATGKPGHGLATIRDAQ